MSFYIWQIFPYLNQKSRKRLELQLGIVLKNNIQKDKLKHHIVQILRNHYLDKFKNILLSRKDHIVKQIFLEGGYLEKKDLDIDKDFPVIEFQEFYYLPMELYEILIKDHFFIENHYLIGLLSLFPEKEIKYWKQWIEEETKIPAKIHPPYKKNIISFYQFVLLSPIVLNVLIKSKEVFSLQECFQELLNMPPLVFIIESFSFYQALKKLYKNSKNVTIRFCNQTIQLKDLLLLFLSGKLCPLFHNNKIEKIILTKELRDIELYTTNENKNIYSLYNFKQF